MLDEALRREGGAVRVLAEEMVLAGSWMFRFGRFRVF